MTTEGHPCEMHTVSPSRAEYSKLRGARWEVGGAPKPPLSWFKLGQASFCRHLLEFQNDQLRGGCGAPLTFPLAPHNFEYLALPQVYTFFRWRLYSIEVTLGDKSVWFDVKRGCSKESMYLTPWVRETWKNIFCSRNLSKSFPGMSCMQKYQCNCTGLIKSELKMLPEWPLSWKKIIMPRGRSDRICSKIRFI